MSAGSYERRYVLVTPATHQYMKNDTLHREQTILAQKSNYQAAFGLVRLVLDADIALVDRTLPRPQVVSTPFEDRLKRLDLVSAGDVAVPVTDPTLLSNWKVNRSFSFVTVAGL